MNFNNTENIEFVTSDVVEDSEVQNAQGEESVLQDTKESDTEVVTTDNSTPAVGSTVQIVDYTSTLDAISNDVHIIMFILLFSFCWSCMKSWRTHSLKGLENNGCFS